MAVDATPITLPSDGTWIEVGSPGYGVRHFEVGRSSGAIFAHAMTQPAIRADIGQTWASGRADNIGIAVSTTDFELEPDYIVKL